ncbi:polyprenyl synthetase family protein [Aquisalinus flavus]|uniref:Geranylgeranyl pyrophosphate synthetase n=1 Tax=Aquisalinus flavus TaxID=1526572 RepID=A0A8J2V262_9PROT|nr:polyprenyl synthetase family protein [Aquisalinus flavus]MBD0427055.1 polyprenyl synthetase family protein [Aquisalinus flavus]GGC98030.1 geranylgeranyl pyrophosphate synthetase [Aquisalinus flavus]
MAFAPEHHGLTEADFARLKSMTETRLADLVPDKGSPARAARHALLSPAKRLRAIMTMLAARQCGGLEEDALDAACAVEMVHTASLIFDDLPAMDDAALRRGVPSTHVAFGEDVAILAGIGLMNGAFGVIARDGQLSNGQKTRLVDILSASIGWAGLVNGQALDLEQEMSQPMSAGARKASTLDEMHHCKTGALFVAAVLSGAECAGADGLTADHLCAYAGSVGLAYQAFDDVLDQVVDDAGAGKSTSRDAGKLTSVTLHGLDRARTMAEQHIEEAIAHARRAGRGDAPLADLAIFISHKFDEKFARTAAE